MVYRIKGSIKDDMNRPLSDLVVEIYDKDVINDDLIGIIKSEDGNFEFTYNTKSFKKGFEILEKGPDLYLVIKDKHGILYKSEVRSNASKDEVFDIIIKQMYEDPYSDSLTKIINAFSNLGDTIERDRIDPEKVIPQMIRMISSWAYYTKEEVMHSIGYDGPQVPRYAKRVEHEHKIPWRIR